MFASRIRASQQEKLDTHAAEWKRRIRDELQMPAEWKETDNGFSVTLRALESGAEIFSMTLTAATRAQAKRFCERKEAPQAFGASCEQCFLVEAGSATVIIGPGSLDQAHTVDEFVEKAQLLRAAKLYREIAMDVLK